MATALDYDVDVQVRDHRQKVRLWGRLSAPGLPAQDVVVTDLSATGFRFERVDTLPEGQAVTIRVGGLPAISGVVVHMTSGGHGCRLDHPLDEDMIEQVRRDGPFAAERPSPIEASPAPLPEPVVPLWPGWARISVIVGGSTICWAGLFVAGRALLS